MRAGRAVFQLQEQEPGHVSAGRILCSLVKGLLEGVSGEQGGRVMEGKWAHEEEVRISDAQGQAHRTGALGAQLCVEDGTQALWGPREEPRYETGDRATQRACDAGEMAAEMGSCANLEREGKSLLPQKQGAERVGVRALTEELWAGCACSSPSLGNTLEFNPNNRDFTGIPYEEPERAVSGDVQGRSLLSEQSWSGSLE